jgi:hypothetical protein
MLRLVLSQKPGQIPISALKKRNILKFKAVFKKKGHSSKKRDYLAEKCADGQPIMLHCIFTLNK